MKNTILILLLFCSLPLLSQTTAITLDSFQHYYYSNGQYILSYTTYYEYNDKAVLTKEYWKLAGNTTVFPIRDMKIYTYSRNLNDTTYQFRAGNTSVLLSDYTVNTYNKDSLIIKKQLFQINADTVISVQTTEWEYDDAKRIIKETNNDASRAYWIYNQDDLLIKFQSQTKLNGIWSNFNHTNYTYNSKKLLTQYQIFYQDTIQRYDNKFYYDNQDREILYISHRMSSWNELKYKDSTAYNAQGQKAGYYYARWENDTWQHPYTRYLYTYDNNGNQTEELVEDWEQADSQWVYSNKEVDLYNNDNQKTHHYWQRWWNRDTEDWYGGFVETYFYNEDGNISEKFINMWVDSLNTFTQDAAKTIYFYSEKEIALDYLPPIAENCPFVNPYPIATPIYCENWEINQMYDLQVFSIDGRIVYNTKFCGLEGFQVNKNLPKAYYIFVILDAGKILQKQKILFIN
jgi:hypothetical protein